VSLLLKVDKTPQSKYLFAFTCFVNSVIVFFCIDETPMVKFGRTEAELNLVCKGKSQTYTANDFCSLQGKFIDPGYIHDVLLTNLQPSKVYYYSCGVPGVRKYYSL
jgi:hypothetical protein